MPTEAAIARSLGPRKTKKTVGWRKVWGWAQIALTLSVGVFWFVALRPQGLAGPASYALVSGTSMEPGYHTGDVVIVHRQDTYQVGDIVSYKIPKGDVGAGAEVIHRLIGGNAQTGWIVQGDNRTSPDIWHPRNEDIVGKAWVHIPNLGPVIKLLHTPLFLACLAAGFAAATVLLRRPGS